MRYRRVEVDSDYDTLTPKEFRAFLGRQLTGCRTPNREGPACLRYKTRKPDREPFFLTEAQLLQRRRKWAAKVIQRWYRGLLAKWATRVAAAQVHFHCLATVQRLFGDYLELASCRSCPASALWTGLEKMLSHGPAPHSGLSSFPYQRLSTKSLRMTLHLSGPLSLAPHTRHTSITAAVSLSHLCPPTQAKARFERGQVVHYHYNHEEERSGPRQPGEQIWRAKAHTGGVTCMLLHNGRMLTGGADKVAKEWDVATAQPSRSFAKAPAWERSTKGEEGDGDGVGKRGNSIPNDIAAHFAPIRGICVSVLGDKMFTCSEDRTIRSWNLASGKTEKQFRGGGNQFTSICQSYRHLLIAGTTDRYASTPQTSDDTRIRHSCLRGACMHLSTGEVHTVCAQSPEAHAKALTTSRKRRHSQPLASKGTHNLSRAAHRFAVAFHQGTGVILQRYRPVNGGEPVFDVCTTGSILFTAGGRHPTKPKSDTSAVARMYDLETGDIVREFVGHSNGLTSISVVSDGVLLTSAADATCRMWDVRTGRQARLFKGHSGPVNAVRGNDARNLLVSAGMDRSTIPRPHQPQRRSRRTQAATPLIPALFSACHLGAIRSQLSGEASPDSSNHISLSRRTLRAWELGSGNQISTLHRGSASVDAVMLSDAADRVYAGFSDGFMSSWSCAGLTESG